MQTRKDIESQFNPVPLNQMTEGQKHRALKITKQFQEMAENIIDLVSPSENRDRIIRHVLDAKFWCIQEITHEGVVDVKSQAPQKASEVQGNGVTQNSQGQTTRSPQG